MKVSLLLPVLCASGFALSCRSTSPSPAGSLQIATGSASKAESGVARVKRMLARAEKEPLRPFEVDEAFLVAESLVQDKQFDDAGRLYRAVFEVNPTLVVGLKLARLKTLTGANFEAETIIRKLALLYPKSAEPPLALAYLAQLRGDKEEAGELLANAYRKHPKDEEVAARYVEFLIEDGKKARAQATLNESIKRMPEAPYFLLRLARLKAEDKKYKEAKDLLDRLLRLSPDSIEGWTLAGFIATEEKNFEGAERYFREAYEKQPENDTLARYYIGQLLRQEKFQDARRLLLKLESSAEADAPIDPELVFQLGFVLFQLEEYPEAKKRFLSLSDKAADAGRMYYYAAQCDEIRKEFTTAKALYEKIPVKSEFHRQGHQRLVYIALETGDFDEARTRLAKYAIGKDSEENDFRFVANVFARLKEYDRSLKTVGEGLKAFPKSAELAYLSAAYLEHTASKKASLEALERFIEKHPKYTPALNHLGYALAEQGVRLEFAAHLLKRAVANEPKNGFYLDSLGWVYFKLNRLEDAEKTLLLALQLEPEEPVILEHLGEVKYARRELALALKYFERADAIFSAKPVWRIESDSEWKVSATRTRQRITELRRMAMPSGIASPNRAQ